jgi:hypothetical protein
MSHGVELYEGGVCAVAQLPLPIDVLILDNIQRIIVPQTSYFFHSS